MFRHEEGRLHTEASLEDLEKSRALSNRQSHCPTQSHGRTTFFSSSTPATKAVTVKLTGSPSSPLDITRKSWRFSRGSVEAREVSLDLAGRSHRKQAAIKSLILERSLYLASFGLWNVPGLSSELSGSRSCEH